MNNKLIIIPLITALVACSSSGDDATPTPSPDNEPTGVKISFGGNSDAWKDATTRAGDTGLEKLYKSFRTWGYKTTDTEKNNTQLVMDGYNVQYYDTDGNKGWEYIGVENSSLSAAQSIKFWDYSATSYRFFGYSPKDAAVTVQSNNTVLMPFAYSPNDDGSTLPYLSDLWFTSNEHDEPPYGQTVSLTFKPLIAKVRFKFSYPEKTTKIRIEDITFQDTRFKDNPSTADTPLRGTISATYPLTGKPTSSRPTLTWTAATENATGQIILTIPYEEEGDRIHILNDASMYGKWYYMPPLDVAEYAQGAYVINATIDGNHSTAIVPAELMQWKAGYQYTYIFKITEAGTNITFSDLQVEQWQEAANIDNNGNGTTGW